MSAVNQTSFFLVNRFYLQVPHMFTASELYRAFVACFTKQNVLVAT